MTGTPIGLGELHQQVRRVRVDDAAAGDDDRALGLAEHVECLLHLGAGGGRLVDRKRCVGVRVELDLGHLHVEREVDQDRAGPSGTHQMECLLEDAWHLSRLQHGHGQLRQRLGDRGDVDGLEILFVQSGDRRLSRDAQDRD